MVWFRKKTGSPLRSYPTIPIQLKEWRKTAERYDLRQKECVKFAPRPNQDDNVKVKNLRYKCRCGELFRFHYLYRRGQDHEDGIEFVTSSDCPQAFKALCSEENWDTEAPKMIPDISWDDPFELSRTYSYGKINFGSQGGNSKPAKYIRVCDEDSVDNVWRFMKEKWKLAQPEKPDVVVSIVGGAKNFRLEGVAREKFENGLLKIAETTQAWFITSGFNVGVMKAVGQIVRDGQTYDVRDTRVTHNIRCLGIAPWGFVKRRHMLENISMSEFEMNYDMSKFYQGSFQPIPLNPYHTHFVFIDNGYRNRFTECGNIASYRAELQEKIKDEFPTVLVVAEGGSGVISDVLYSLRSGIPVVICKGTGRAADIFAYAVTRYKDQEELSDTQKEKLKKQLDKQYGETWPNDPDLREREVEKLFMDVVECLGHQQLINIFDVRQDQGLDYAVLLALFKCPVRNRRQHLDLAISWNRPDVAELALFGETDYWEMSLLSEYLSAALVHDIDGFVRLFLRQDDLDVGEFLTKQRLLDLYKESMDTGRHLLSHLLSREAKVKSSTELTLRAVGKVLKLLLHSCDRDVYYGEKEEIEHPNLHLFIWAVLSQKESMALVFWERVDAPIATALLGCWMYNSMSKQIKIASEELMESLMEKKTRMENLAVESLTRLHKSYPKQARDCIVKDLPFWNDATCLSLAAAADAKTFVSTGPCQYQLRAEWNGDVRMSKYRVILSVPLAVFFPCLISIWGSFYPEVEHLSRIEKLSKFYTSPRVKFTLHVITYLTFLMLFTYLILFDIQENASVLEGICFVWTLSILMDELHRFICVPAVSFRSRVFLWRGFLYSMYILGLVMVVVGFFLHILTNRLRAVMSIYSFNCVFFYIRILRFYTASENLGPMLHIIKSTLRLLLFFGMIGVVFLCAYGIPAQALMYERRQPYWGVFYDIFYLPYWQIYGELQLENIETDESCMSNYNSTDMEVITPCRKSSKLVPLLLAVYLFFANVLLLNLIIATFTRIFETVERSSIKIWKYQMYFFIKEYSSKSVLPLPLSLIEDCVRIILHICNCLCPGCSRERKGLKTSKRLHLRWVERQVITRIIRQNAGMESSSIENSVERIQRSDVQSLGRVQRRIDTDTPARSAGVTPQLPRAQPDRWHMLANAHRLHVATEKAQSRLDPLSPRKRNKSLFEESSSYRGLRVDTSDFLDGGPIAASSDTDSDTFEGDRLLDDTPV